MRRGRMQPCKGIAFSYGQKMLFYEILSAELGTCRFHIDATYVWKRPEQILSAAFSDAGRLRLEINLHVTKDALFHGDRAVEHSICFRAYFIAAYIRCIESAYDRLPQTYFEGLVLLNALNDRHSGRRVAVATPIADKRRPGTLRPLEVHCAILALTRMLLVHAEELSPRERKEAERRRDELLCYSSLPEVAYEKSRQPSHALFSELHRLRQTLASAPQLPEACALFQKNGMQTIREMTVEELLRACEKTEDRFWNGVALRFAACAAPGCSRAWFAPTDRIPAEAAQYLEDSVTYFKEQRDTASFLLRENLSAVKQTAGRIQLWIAETEFFGDSGTIHYVQ